MGATKNRRSLPRDLLYAVAPLGIGGALTLAWSIASVRVFGTTAFGQLALGIAIGSVLRTIAILGLDRAIITPIAQARHDGRWREGSRLAMRAMALVAATLTAMVAVGWATQDAASSWLGTQGYPQSVVVIGLVAAVSGSTMSMATGISLGAGRFRELISGRQMAIRGTQTGAVIVTGWLGSIGIVEPTLGILASIYVTTELLGALLLATRAIKSLRTPDRCLALSHEGPANPRITRLIPTIARGLPITAQAAASALCSDGSKLLLVAYGAAPEAIGAFTVMLQVASFSAMGYSTIVQAAMSHGARAIAEGDGMALQRDYTLVTVLGTIPAAGLLAMSLSAGDALLQPWGISRPDCHAAMIAVSLAQVLDVMLGPTGTALTVSQQSTALLRSAAGSAMAFIAGGMILVPNLGLVGAGATIGLSRLIRHGICVRALKQRVGLEPSPHNLVKILACAAAAAIGGWITSLVSGSPRAMALAVSGATYGCLVAWVFRQELTAILRTRLRH